VPTTRYFILFLSKNGSNYFFKDLVNFNCLCKDLVNLKMLAGRRGFLVGDWKTSDMMSRVKS